MSRSTARMLAAAVIAAVLVPVAGCSAIPNPLDMLSSSKPPAAPVASPSPAAGKAATATPAVSTTTSGTVAPVPKEPGAPKQIMSSDIDGIDLRALQAKGAYLVDLRTPFEYTEQHIDGAVNVPMATFAGTAAKWPRSRAVIVYDRTGAQGQVAQSWLERNGFTEIYHLFRGIEGYDVKLVGKHPTPIPPKEPVLYYFYYAYDASTPIPEVINLPPTFKQGDIFAHQLKSDFDGRFEYHAINIGTLSGLKTALEFGLTGMPGFRLIDQKGHVEQFAGTGTFETVRAHLKRAIEAYSKSR